MHYTKGRGRHPVGRGLAFVMVLANVAGLATTILLAMEKIDPWPLLPPKALPWLVSVTTSLAPHQTAIVGGLSGTLLLAALGWLLCALGNRGAWSVLTVLTPAWILLALNLLLDRGGLSHIRGVTGPACGLLLAQLALLLWDTPGRWARRSPGELPSGLSPSAAVESYTSTTAYVASGLYLLLALALMVCSARVQAAVRQPLARISGEYEYTMFHTRPRVDLAWWGSLPAPTPARQRFVIGAGELVRNVPVDNNVATPWGRVRDLHQVADRIATLEARLPDLWQKMQAGISMSVGLAKYLRPDRRDTACGDICASTAAYVRDQRTLTTLLRAADLAGTAQFTTLGCLLMVALMVAVARRQARRR